MLQLLQENGEPILQENDEGLLLEPFPNGSLTVVLDDLVIMSMGEARPFIDLIADPNRLVSSGVEPRSLGSSPESRHVSSPSELRRVNSGYEARVVSTN